VCEAFACRPRGGGARLTTWRVDLSSFRLGRHPIQRLETLAATFSPPRSERADGAREGLSREVAGALAGAEVGSVAPARRASICSRRAASERSTWARRRR